MTVLLTREKYRELFGGSRQSIHNKIRRGTLKTTRADVTQTVELIEVPDDVFHSAVKAKECTA